jgi:hypothetical protein
MSEPATTVQSGEPMTAAPTAPTAPAAPAERGRHRYHGPPTWVPVSVVVVVIAVIQLLLPKSVTIGPLWLIPAVELIGVPIIVLVWFVAKDPDSHLTDRLLDSGMTAYLCFLIAASALNAGLLLTTLLIDVTDSPTRLLFAGFAVLVINVLTFGLIYWWLDGGGPRVRAMGEVEEWDFQYPQQASGHPDWTPRLPDYFYTAYTNVIAFSPTDTMPLTPRVKLLFTLESAISLLTILVTVSRAINMLP